LLSRSKAVDVPPNEPLRQGERMIFAIEPHRGIGPVSFGMTRSDVIAAVAACGGGSPVARNKETACFFDNAFQVSFGDAGRADFIEVCSGISVEVRFDGRDVFDIHADDLLALIRGHEQEDPALSDPDDSYIFAGLILTLWGRDEQYDHEGGEQRPMFAKVGVGALSYLAAIRAIRMGE
jgi:hypothetical protein